MADRCLEFGVSRSGAISFIYLTIELELIDQGSADKLLESATTCQKLINGLIRSSKARL